MNPLLDQTGALLFVAFRIIILPLLLALYVFFAVLFLIRSVNSGIKAMRKMKIGKLAPLYRLTKYGNYLGRFVPDWAWHR